MIQLTERSFKRLIIALGIYLTSLFAANTLGLKLMPFIFGTNLSVAVFSFPVVFLMTDVIGEVYGKRIAKFFVLAGFISTALFIAYSLISLAGPWSAKGEWVRIGYNQVFGVSVRIAIASLVAFLIAEYQDVFSFFFFRQNLPQFFWLRSLLSNLWSQALDTVIFYDNRFCWRILHPHAHQVLWFLGGSTRSLWGFLYTPLFLRRILLAKKKKWKPNTYGLKQPTRLL